MKKLLLFTILLISFSSLAGVEDLKSVHLMKNKYAQNCVEMRNKFLKELESAPLAVVEEIIWSIQNEILQEGIIRARDLDLRDLIVIWIKKTGIKKIKSNPDLLFLSLGVHKRYIHSYRMALEEIEGVTIHPEMKKVAFIIKS